MTVIDLSERRQLRDLARGVDELSTRIDAALLQAKPHLAEQLLDVRLAELQLRWKSILGAAREGALDAIAVAIAAQIAAGDEPDVQRAVLLVFRAAPDELVRRAEAAVAALPSEVARVRETYGPSLLNPQE